MFSPTLELILTIAHREANARRHTHLTLEHLLYALAHDAEGEEILAAVGVDLRRLRMELDAYLTKSLDQVGRGQAVGAETADRHAWTVEGERRNDRVDT